MFFFFTDDEADTAVPVDAVANSKQEQKKIIQILFSNQSNILMIMDRNSGMHENCKLF